MTMIKLILVLITCKLSITIGQDQPQKLNTSAVWSSYSQPPTGPLASALGLYGQYNPYYQPNPYYGQQPSQTQPSPSITANTGYQWPSSTYVQPNPSNSYYNQYRSYYDNYPQMRSYQPATPVASYGSSYPATYGVQSQTGQNSPMTPIQYNAYGQPMWSYYPTNRVGNEPFRTPMATHYPFPYGSNLPLDSLQARTALARAESLNAQASAQNKGSPSMVILAIAFLTMFVMIIKF